MYSDKTLKNAFIMDYWDRASVREFGYILQYYSNKIGKKIDRFNFDEDGYRSIAEIADELIIESLKSKTIKRVISDIVINEDELQEIYDTQQNADKGVDSIKIPTEIKKAIKSHNIDDFIEILTAIKHIVYNVKFEDLYKEKEEWEEEVKNMKLDEKEQKKSIFDCLKKCIGGA